MGEGITFECPNCSTKRTFLRRVGIEYSSLDHILKSVEPDHRQETQRKPDALIKSEKTRCRR